LVNGSSELDETNLDFTGLNKYRGVNPATGAVLYFSLPSIKEEEQLTLTIKDATGNTIKTIYSKPDSTYKKYDGGPSEDAVLSKNKGLNRFVWNLRYPTMLGVSDVYIESSYKGHKVIPGNYTATLTYGNKQVNTAIVILPNPLYNIDGAVYKQYDEVMIEMEQNVTQMHQLVNSLYQKQQQLTNFVKQLPVSDKYLAIKNEANIVINKMKVWDEAMIQRKSKAYDDVENFENKFTANYMFLLNQTESDLPRVNQPNLDRLNELNSQWKLLQKTANDILQIDIPALNKAIWQLGIGAIWN
jgi:hypothetical protein